MIGREGVRERERGLEQCMKRLADVERDRAA
jgi:hypothetical protein